MDIFKNTNVPEHSYQLSEFKNEIELSVNNETVNKNNANISLMEDHLLANTNGLMSSHEENNIETDDNDEDGIYSPLADDALLQDVTKTVTNKIVMSSPNETSKDLCQIQSPEKVISPINSDAQALVIHCKVDENEKEKNTIQCGNEFYSPKVDENGKQVFKEVSVQTIENKQNVFCPICEIENERLKNKIFSLFLEYSQNKRKIIELEKNVINIDGNEDIKKTMLSSDVQIDPKSTLDMECDKDEKKDTRELSSKKIRLGLSRRVKLLPLHQLPSSKKTQLPVYSSK